MLPEKKENRVASTAKNCARLRRAGLCFLLLAASAAMVLSLPWTQRKMVGAVLDKVEKLTAMTIKVESYEWVPFSQMRLGSLRVQSGREDFLRCEMALLDYRLSFKWPYVIPTVLLLDKPEFRLQRDGRGKWSIPRQATSRDKVPPRKKNRVSKQTGFWWRDFPWPQVQVRSGRILAFQQGELVLSVQNFTGTVPFRVMDGGDVPVLKIQLDQWHGDVVLQ